MGNNQKKSFQGTDLFIQVEKNIYQSGEIIDGKIHLGVPKAKPPYETLILGLYCRESFLVKASKEKDVSYETMEKFCYITEQVVVDFKATPFSEGQYCFPFQIKLPQNMPSNFLVSQHQDPQAQDPKRIETRYAIKAELIANSISKYGNLTKLHHLNILKPFKESIQPLNIQKNQQGRSCFCFGNFNTKVSIFVNKNFAYSGEKLEINGEVNNAQGSRNLEGLNCQLIERNIVTNEKRKFYKEKERGVLHVVKNFKAKKGNVENFSFSYKIPDYLQHSYSIGNYSALVYVLKFQYIFKEGCDPHRSIQIPIFIETKTPKLQVNIDEIPSSYEWNPIIKDTIKLDMNESFVYNTEYPLQSYRNALKQNKVDLPSFNYFNQMNAGYPSKQPTQNSNEDPQSRPIQSNVNDAQSNLHGQQNKVNPENYGVNPYYTTPDVKRRIFPKKSQLQPAKKADQP